MHKLHAVKYHLRNYRRIEKEQYVRATREFKKNPQQTREAFELIFELDAFLVQVKSSLDMLSRLLTVVVGKGFITGTFGAKGNKLIKGLTQYRKKSGVKVAVVDDLVSVIEEDRDSWLGSTVEFRDRLNHVAALQDYKFLPVRLSNGDIAVKKPAFEGCETVPRMDLIYQNNLEFHQDFVSLALSLRVPGLDLAKQDPKESESLYGPPGRYIKFRWMFSTDPKEASKDEALTCE